MIKHKSLETFKSTIKSGIGAFGLKLFPYQIELTGRKNINLKINFEVLQPTSYKRDIRLYILTEKQFLDWIPNIMGQSGLLAFPKYCIHYSGQVVKANFEFRPKENMYYFFFDNRYSSFTIKNIRVSIIEEWDEEEPTTKLAVTLHPKEKSLFENISRIIKDSKEQLLITTPYLDSTLMDEIIEQFKQGVEIKILTRPRNEMINKDSRVAFDYLQENLKQLLRVNTYIHSRIIIKDKTEVLVSSADLLRDSFRTLFNAGITTTEKNIVKKTLDYFDKVWAKSKTP